MENYLDYLLRLFLVTSENSDIISFRINYKDQWASLVAQLVMNPPAMWEIWLRSLDWEDPLEKGKATHSSILAWKIPQRSLAGYSLWISPGQYTGVGSLSLLQWIFPTQRSNPGLPHCRWILYQLNHKESPRILEWVAYPSSSRSSWPGIKPVSTALEGRFLNVIAFDEFYLWIVVHMDS